LASDLNEPYTYEVRPEAIKVYGHTLTFVEFLPREVENFIGHFEESLQVVRYSLKILRPYGLVIRLGYRVVNKMTEMSSSIGPGYATGVYSPHLNLYVEISRRASNFVLIIER
jgi:hypothetical protein